jgi:hypothetical protein
MEQAETSRVTAVTDGGYHLKLATVLRYEHLGETREFPGGHRIDFRADVALLTRNVVVQGDESSWLDRHGVHIMLHSRRHDSVVDRSQGESLIARIAPPRPPSPWRASPCAAPRPCSRRASVGATALAALYWRESVRRAPKRAVPRV